MTLYPARSVITLPAAQQQLANEACEAVAKGGVGTFGAVKLNATGLVSDAVTTLMCNWQMLPEERKQLEAEFTKRGVLAVFDDCDDWDPALSTVSGDTVARKYNLKVIAADVVAAPSLAAVAPLPQTLSVPVERVATPTSPSPLPTRRSWWLRLWVRIWVFLKRLLRR